MNLDRIKQRLARSARPAGWVSAALAVAVVAGCGGGTSAVTAFEPTRLLSFGDEYSVFESDGSRYTINALDASGEIDCTLTPIWVQDVASQVNLTFPECNPLGDPDPTASSFAQANAKVADVVGQVESYTARGGTFDSLTLVTVLAGTADVLEQYPLYETEGEAALLAALKLRGERLGELVNDIVNAGARVIVVTNPDVGRSPFALAQQARFTDTDRAALLSRMNDSFNRAMLLKLPNDGRLIGLVQADDQVRSASRFPGSYGLSNAASGACDVALPLCTTDTLVVDASVTTHLWADDTRLGPVLQQRIGQLAADRVANNPF